MKPNWDEVLNAYFSVSNPVRDANRAFFHEAIPEDIEQLKGIDVDDRYGPLFISHRYYQNTTELNDYLRENVESLKGKRILDIGAGMGLTALYGNSIGLDVSSLETMSKFRAGSVMCMALNGVDISIMKDYDKIGSYDVILFAKVFFDEASAEINMDAARRLRSKGKQVIIWSESLCLGVNQFIALKPGETKRIGPKTTYLMEMS